MFVGSIAVSLMHLANNKHVFDVNQIPLVQQEAHIDWNNPKMRRYYFELQMQKMNGDVESLYNLTSFGMYSSSAAGPLISFYQHSVALAVCTEFPDHAWQAWRFSQSPRRYWSNVISNMLAGDAIAECCIRLYFDFKASEIGVPVQQWTEAHMENFNYDPFLPYGGIRAIRDRLYGEPKLAHQQPSSIPLNSTHANYVVITSN